MTITVEGPGGATVEFPDGTSADTINTVMTQHFGGAKKYTPPGVGAGASHGVSELVNGPAETLKRFAGVGPGRKDDPNYVPANVSNGSFDPRKWNYSQLPQKIAELTPSVGEAALGAGAGAKIGGVAGAKGKLLGGLIGAMVPNLFNTAGDTAREVTAARTGNQNAESSTADLVRGGATATAASLANALLPTRLAPGFLKPGNVGMKGVAEGAANYLGTTALGGAGGMAGDAITQVGTTGKIDTARLPEAMVGGLAAGATLATPKLLGDTVRAGANAKFGGDNAEPMSNYATRLATAGEGLGGLGNGKRDRAAHELVVKDLKNELGDAAQAVRQTPGVKLSPDADNALQRAQRGDTITPKELELIKSETAAAPDGANAHFLAHTLRMAQLAQGRGVFGDKSWTGGLSGAMEKSVGYMLNPMRLAGGGIATYALGLNPLGLLNPKTAGAIAAGYGGARVLDSATGMRSPAKSYAEHFASKNATLRKPQTPQAAPAAPPPPSTAPWGPRPPMAGPTGPQVGPPMAPPGVVPGPWGPKPLPTTSVPNVQPAAPPAPPTPDPIAAAKAMLAQRAYLEKVKRNSAEPEAPAAPAAPEPVNPLMLPRDITTPAKNLMAGFKNTGKMENTYNTETRKAEGVAQAEALAAESPTINEQGGLSSLISPDAAKHGGSLLKAAAIMRKLAAAGPEEVAASKQAASEAKAEERAAKEQARAEAKAQTATERAQAKAERARIVAENAAVKAEQVKAKEAAKAEQVKAKAEAVAAKDAVKLANAKLKATAAAAKAAPAAATPTPEAAPPQPKKITKKAGKVNTEEPALSDVPYAPLAEEHLYPKGISPKEYAAFEAAAKNIRSDTYRAKAEASETRRAGIASDLKAKHPKAARAIDWLHRELQKAGNNPAEIARVVKYAQDNVTADVAASMEAFKK